MAALTGTRLYALLKEDIIPDITFLVQGQEIKAHRFVALSQGGLLRELLLTKKENTIQLSDEIGAEIFRTVLQYIYTDSCDITDQNLFGVIHAAKVLGLEQLERYCADAVKGKLGVSNVATYAAHAVELDAKENIQTCQDYFRKNTTEVIKSKGFTEVSYDVLMMFCNSEGLNCSEVELFTACVQWAKSECLRQRRETTPENLRAVLREVLTKIRFPVMPRKEFEDIVMLSKILPFEDVGRLMFGLKTGENISQFSSESRTEVVEVTFRDHFSNKTNHCLPLSTKIGDLKEKEIFYIHDEAGRRKCQQCPADKATLCHNGIELRDDETLQSVYTPGKKLDIGVHSVQVQVKDINGAWEFPLMVMVKDFSKVDQIVRGNIYAFKGISPDKVSWVSGYVQPGGFYRVSVK